MKYRHMDGFRFEADNARQACEILWQSMFDPNDTIEEWMAGSSKRAAIWNGSQIRTDSCENHFADLIAAGFIIPEDDGENSGGN